MFLLSKPLRLRGLKFGCTESEDDGLVVEAFAASWIEIFEDKRKLRPV